MAFNPGPTGRGYDVYEVISSLQKAIRRSETEAAVYWAVELHKSGHETWAWNRLREIMSEDVGPLERTLPATFEALYNSAAAEKKRKPGGGGLQIVHATMLLATAEKTRVVAQGFIAASSDNHERLEIPDHALDRHTRRGKAMGRGVDHFLKEAAKIIQPTGPLFDVFRNLEDKYLHERLLRMNKQPVHNNPWHKASPKAKPGTVTTSTDGGPTTHQIPGTEK